MDELKSAFGSVAGTVGFIAAIGAMTVGFAFLNDPEGTALKVRHFFNVATGSTEAPKERTINCTSGRQPVVVVNTDKSVTLHCD